MCQKGTNTIKIVVINGTSFDTACMVIETTFVAIYTLFIRCKEKRFWHVLNFAVFFFFLVKQHIHMIIVEKLLIKIYQNARRLGHYNSCTMSNVMSQYPPCSILTHGSCLSTLHL